MHDSVDCDALQLALPAVINYIRKWATKNMAADRRFLDHAPPYGINQNACDSRLNYANKSLRYFRRRLAQVLIGGFSIFQERVRVEAISRHRLRPRAVSTSRRTRRIASSAEIADTSPDSTSEIRRRTSVS